MNLHQKITLIGIREDATELAGEIALIMAMDRPGVLVDEAALRNAEERALNAVHDIAGKLGFKLVNVRADRSEVPAQAAE